MRLHPCTVTCVTIDTRTGGVIQSQAHNMTAIAFCIDEGNHKCLVVGTDDKKSREFRVAGGVKLHTRFASQGKATLTLVKRNINLMISNADPDSLIEWTATLTSGRPPAPRAAPTATAVTSPRPASAPPKRMLAPLTPSRANTASSPGQQQQAPRSKGKMGRGAGCSRARRPT